MSNYDTFFGGLLCYFINEETDAAESVLHCVDHVRYRSDGGDMIHTRCHQSRLRIFSRMSGIERISFLSYTLCEACLPHIVTMILTEQTLPETIEK